MKSSVMFLLFLVVACTAPLQRDDSIQMKSVPSQFGLTQGVQGKIGLRSGNCMPPDVPRECDNPPGIRTRAYITHLLPNEYEQNALVAIVETDANGNFAYGLAPGNYSLFIEDVIKGGKTVVCPYWQGGEWTNPETHKAPCAPFKVNEGNVTSISAHLNYAAD